MFFQSDHAVKLSSLARVRVMAKCLGPDASMVMNGWLISVVMVPESSIFAFSAASRKPLQGHFIFAQIDAFLFFEGFEHPLQDFVVKIIAAKVGISVGCEHFKDSIADFQNGDIKSTAA